MPKDVTGFIVNRIFIPLVHEAAILFRKGRSLDDSNRFSSKVQDGFPYGYF